MKKKLLVLCLALSMVFCFSACGGTGTEGGDAEAPTELVMIDSEWFGIDTFQLDESAGGQSFLSTPPFAWDADNSCVVDNVCTDWTVSEDGSKVTFNVPEGLKFSTGEDLLPEDVKASIEHGLKVSPYAEGYENIESIDIDGQQVTLNLSHYSSDMEYYFTADFICIIDKDELDSMTDEELLWGAHPYGPYYLAEGGYVSGSEVNAIRFDDYKCFDPRVENHGPWAFEKIKLRFNVEDFTETEELKNGTVHSILSLSMDQVLELENNEDIDIVEAAYPCINYLELNTDTPGLDDIEVRKAIELALDREATAEIVDNSVVPAYSIIYDTMQCFNKDMYDYYKENFSNDPEKAKELLEAAGWTDSDGDGIREKDGKKCEFTVYSWDSYSTIMESFAAQLEAVGIKMNIEFLEWTYIYDKMEHDDFDCGTASLGWAEPILIFNMCYYDRNDPGNTKAYRKLIDEAAGEPDPEKRVEKVGEVEKSIIEQHTLIPMFGDNGWTAFGKGITGYKAMSDGTIPLNDLHFE